MATFPTSPSNGDTYLKGQTLYVYSSANNSWTQTPLTIGTLQHTAIPDNNANIDYYIIGKYYIIAGITFTAFTPNISLPPYNDSNTLGIITSTLGITVNTTFTYNNPSSDTSSNTHSAKYAGGGSWQLGGNATNIKTKQIILDQ